MAGDREAQGMEDVSTEVTMEELQEFLEGDRGDLPVDAEFKENLRRNLWEMVRLRFKKRSDA